MFGYYPPRAVVIHSFYKQLYAFIQQIGDNIRIIIPLDARLVIDVAVCVVSYLAILLKCPWYSNILYQLVRSLLSFVGVYYNFGGFKQAHTKSFLPFWEKAV